MEGLLREAVEVELSRADGTISSVPHYSVIERQAHELGKQFSREVQQRQMGELTALQPQTAKCPECGTRCKAQPRKRKVNTADALAARPESPPTLAVVECDGGRTRTREPGHGRGASSCRARTAGARRRTPA